MKNVSRSQFQNWVLVTAILVVVFITMFFSFASHSHAMDADKSPDVANWAPIFGAEERVVFNTTAKSGLVARVYLDPAKKMGAGLVISVFYENGSEEPIFKFWGLNTSKEEMTYSKEDQWVSSKGLVTGLYIRSPNMTLIGVKMVKPNLSISLSAPEVQKLDIQVLDSKGKVNGIVAIDFTK